MRAEKIFSVLWFTVGAASWATMVYVQDIGFRSPLNPEPMRNTPLQIKGVTRYVTRLEANAYNMAEIMFFADVAAIFVIGGLSEMRRARSR